MFFEGGVGAEVGGGEFLGWVVRVDEGLQGFGDGDAGPGPKRSGTDDEGDVGGDGVGGGGVSRPFRVEDLSVEAFGDAGFTGAEFGDGERGGMAWSCADAECGCGG